MVRVLFYCGIIALGVSAALLYLSNTICAVICALLLLAVILIAVFKKKNKFNNLVCFILAFLFSAFGLFSLYKVDCYNQIDGEKATVSGLIESVSIRESGYAVYNLKSDSIVLKDGSNAIFPKTIAKIFIF